MILRTRTLNDLRERVKHLTGNSDGLKEINFSSRINQLLARIMPIEVHNRLLQSQQVIDSADYHVDCGGISSLSSQIVLPLKVVTLASELDEAEKRTSELCVMHVLFTSSAF